MIYFALDEDFAKIAKQTLPDEHIAQIHQITTGWTNLVLEVKTDQTTYIFRFPRDDFWSKTIEKDAEIAQFIHGKTDFTTVYPELLYDAQHRPFTRHRKLKGTPLADQFSQLSPAEIKIIAQEIATFLHQLHHIEYNLSDVFPKTNFGHHLVDFLDELLREHILADSLKFWNYDQLKTSPAECLVHGDFNTSNVLIGDDRHVAAILDFGFGGVGNKYFDVNRIVSRDYPAPFKDELLTAYENLSGHPFDRSQGDQTEQMWRHIDQAYIDYMTKIGIYHP